MALFYVTAISTSGEKSTKTYDFSDELSLYEFFDRTGMSVVSIRKLPNFMSSNQVKGLFRSIKTAEVIEMLTNLHIIIASGMAATTGIEDLAKDAENPAVADLLTDIANRLQNGESMSTAMAAHSNVFDEITISLVKIGEETGALEQTLQDAIKNLKRVSDLIKKTKSALMYPVTAFFALTGAMIFWLVAVMPEMLATFTSFDMELPATTIFIRDLSDFIAAWWLFIIGGIAATIILFKVLRKHNEQFLFQTDKLLLKVPVIGELVASFNLAFFSEYVRLMISAGLPLYQSLNILEESMTNTVYKKAVSEVRDSIEMGSTFANGIIQTGVFTSLASRMISVGEQSGRLEEQLTHISGFYYDRVDTLSSNMAKAIEPIVLAFAGGMMALFIVGLLGPVYGLLENMGGV